MEPWVPQRLSQPQGRPIVPSKAPNRSHRREGYPHPVPQSRHNGERLQRQDTHRSPQPQQDPRAGHLQSHYSSNPGVDYYEGGYVSHFYPRPGIEDWYQSYHSPTLREDYAYRRYYHHGLPQQPQEERVPRQGSPYNWREDYHDLKQLNEQKLENQKNLSGENGEAQFQSKNCNSYRESPATNSGQEWTGDLPPESLLAGTQKKLLLTGKSNLLQQQESGLSSSSYELSQYMADTPEPPGHRASAAWSPVQAEDVSATGPKAPMKFYIPHVPVSFGPGGQLVRVGSSLPSNGPRVELHSMEVILSDSEEQEEMRAFSGPLIREDVHKVDIMTFCQQKATQSRKSDTPGSRDAALLWQLLVLLCRQNGSMVGSDIAELLMQDCQKLDKYKRQTPVANLINLSDEDWPVLSSATPNLLTGEVPPNVLTQEQIVEKFTKLLYYGRKKEALEWAMKNHLWGHALFLSSKMDPRTYSWVMSGFTSTLALNDPLQTLFHLMSGRIPQATTFCGDKQWGDWRPHLAVILSNQGGDAELQQRTIIAMGDTLAGKGLLEAAHFCYLMAHVPFGYYTVKTDHLALLGSSHSQEFWKFATIEAIQRTEIFEYCQLLGHSKSFIPSFQVYKFLYASRLADAGLISQALYYCEAIGTALLSQEDSSHPVLLAELIKLAEKLKLSDPLLLERHRGDRDPEPDWLMKLRRQQEALQQKAGRDDGVPGSAHLDILGARGVTSDNHTEEPKKTFYQDPSACQDDSEVLGDGSAPWQTPKHAGLVEPSLQQAFPLQPGFYPVDGGVGHMGVPVPLYSVPQTYVPRTGGSLAGTGAPGGRAYEEIPQTHLPSGENTVSQETFQHPDDPEAVPRHQDPPIARTRTSSQSSAKDEEEQETESESELSADESNTNSSSNPVQQGAADTKGSGFGWFSWFRSKPKEVSSDSSGSEEIPRAPSHPKAGLDLSLTTSPEFQPLSTVNTSSGSTGGIDIGGPGPVSGGVMTEGTRAGGPSGPEAISSELYFNPGALLPPPTFTGGIPLYNPSQISQLSMAPTQNRLNRLAQRRYPTQL
ncbi:protein transport protein Sec16B isoform X1 [Erinaceus europaeus]|uniref:Protein transport protein sec16 n=1 Tax=Erinaceus europaeus TaxID=9365 RepID=A0A1S3WS67_ERIEU|nr:protein transport protein Sec16B isoform X1 [Erinaceus europaeus]